MNASAFGRTIQSRACGPIAPNAHHPLGGLVGFGRLIAGLVDRSLVDVTIIGVGRRVAVWSILGVGATVGFRLSGRLAFRLSGRLAFGVHLVPLVQADRVAAVGRLPHLIAGRLVHDPFAVGVVSGLPIGLVLALCILGLGSDVDAQAGEAVGQAGILTLLADRQAQLEVGNDHLGGAQVTVDAHLAHPCRLKRLGNKLDLVIGERHDVDLLAP